MQFVGPMNSNVTSEHVPYQSDLADTGSVSQHPERCDNDTVQQYVVWPMRVEALVLMQSHLDRTPTTEDILNELRQPMLDA